MSLLTKFPIRGIYNILHGRIDNFVLDLVGNTAPVNGTSGTGAGYAGPASSYTDIVAKQKYYNIGTKASPTWMVLFGITAGGAANSLTELTKEVTGIVDNTATAILTVTIPNSAQAGMIDFALVGRLGAGGAIGADEAVSSSRYQATFVRTPGVASVLTLSGQLGVVNVAVAGAATSTAILTAVANAEGVGVTNTHTIKATITKSGGASALHKADVRVELYNSNASGVTIA